MKQQTVSVIGLGKLGLPFAVCWAERGFNVIGVDRNPERVAAVQAGIIDDVEADIAALLQKNSHRMQATTDIYEAVAASEAVFILVNTPGEASGKFTNRYVLSVCEELGPALRDNPGRLVVLASSVTPGSLDAEIKPALDALVGQSQSSNYELCYSPVFIALGSQVGDYLEPDLALIGSQDQAAADRLEVLLQAFYRRDDVPFVKTNFINAELIKLVLSTFITTKISYANMLAQLCDHLPGADTDVVAEAIGLDKRISPKVLKGGMPYGGPCFPRDNRALLYLTETVGIDGSVVRATDTFNSSMTMGLVRQVLNLVEADQTVGVLGLAFKPNTDVIDESPSVLLANRLSEAGVTVSVFDPQALEAARAELRPAITQAHSFTECVTFSDVVIVATPWAEFAQLPKAVRGREKKLTVIDPWRLFKAEDFGDPISYQAIGRGNQPVPTVVEETHTSL